MIEETAPDLVAQRELGASVTMPGVDAPETTVNTEPKRGRGRPPGSKNKPKENEPKIDLTEETLNGMLTGLFNILGERQEHWRLSPAEAKMLTDVTYKFLVSLSDKIGKYVGIGTLITVWAVIILPRLVKSKQLSQESTPHVVAT